MSFPGAELKRAVTQTKVDVTNSSSAETEHEFQKWAKSFTLICNDFEQVRISWVSSEVDDASGNWFVLYPRESYSEEDILLSGNDLKSIYMNAPDAAANVDVVIVEWA